MPTNYPPTNYLALAKRHADAYEERLYCDDFPGTDAERQEWQSQPYTLALLNATIAQAEALARIADALSGPSTRLANARGITMPSDESGFSMVGKI